MPPKRPSSRTQQPVQRRPRTEKACNFCRIAKQRCEPIEYGTNDRPCRRCVSQGLNCNLPRVARSQSPSSGLGVQGHGPIQYPITSHSADGATEELTLDSETSIQYTFQQSEPGQISTRRWAPLAVRSEEQHGSSILLPGQTSLQVTSLLPTASVVGGYRRSFPHVAQGSNDTEPSYYSQDYYRQTTPGDPYITSYASQSASGAPNLGYTLEDPQPNDAGPPVAEQDESLSRSGEA